MDHHSKLLSSSNVHHVHLHKDHQPKSHAHAIVRTIGNHNLNLKMSQMPSTEGGRLSNVWRYPASGSYSTTISSGSQVVIPIIRGTGSGHVLEAYLRLVITNSTGSAVRLVDIPHLIDYIEFRTPAGAQIQQLNSDELFFNCVRYFDDESFKKIAKMINSTEKFGKGISQANSTTETYMLPLIGNWLQNSGFPIWMVDGDIHLIVQFKSSSLSVVSGSAPTLADMSLDVRMENLSQIERSSKTSIYQSMPHHWYVVFPKRQSFTQALTASTTYEFNLSSIKGDVLALDFWIRATESGDQYRKFYPVSSFSLLNAEGDEISSQNVITSDFNRYILQSEYYPSSFSNDNPVYSWNFSMDDHAPMSFLFHGEKSHSSYPFTTHERLQITMGAAGTNEVQTVTPSVAAADGGTFVIQWITPYGTEQTAALAYGSDAAAIKAAIEGLLTFDGTVTVANDFTASGTPGTVTFGGNYSYMPLFSRGYKLQVWSTSANDGGVTAFYVTTASTPGVYGFNSNGSHTLNVVAYTSSLLTLRNGSLDIRYT